MAGFSGSFSYSADRPDLDDGDESDFYVATNGSVSVSLSVDGSGIVTGSGVASTAMSADAIGEQDAGEIDGFSDSTTQNVVSVSGFVSGGVEISWGFATSGFVDFHGTFNSAGTAIIGTATVTDSGGDTSLTLDVPMTLSGSPLASDLQGLADFLNQTGHDIDETLLAAKASLAAEGKTVAQFVKELESPAFRATSTLSDIVAMGATIADAGGHLINGDIIGAKAAVMTGLQEWAMAENANDITETGIGLLTVPGLEPAGAGLITIGVQQQVKLIVDSDEIDNTIRTFWINYFSQPGHSLPASTSDSASAFASAVQPLQIPINPGIPIHIFDPGYYLANHPDAVAAVASGASPSAYAYYLTTGINRGDLPSAGSTPISPSDIADLAVLKNNLNGFVDLYTGIFDLALGSMPTDGLSTTEQTVGHVAFAGHGIADTTLTALSNRLAIDLARNQHLSGTGENFGAGQVPATLSIGASLSDLEQAAAPGFTNFSFYALSTVPGETLSQIEAALVDDVLRDTRPVTSATAYGIAEFGGVWVGVVADAKSGVQTHAAPAEASGGATINFYGTNGDDLIFLGSHAGTALGGPGNDVIIGSAGNDTLNGGPGADTLTGKAGVDTFVFDAAALTDARAGISDDIRDYDQGSTGAYSVAEGDKIDLSAVLSAAYAHGNGKPVATLVRAVEDPSGAFATLQIDPDGTTWATVARLDNLHTGNSVNVVLDSTLPAGLSIQVLNIPSTFIGPGDFDADSDPAGDVLWQNPDGTVVTWDLNGPQLSAQTSLGQLPVNWHVAAIGDFNGDKNSDLLIESDSGLLLGWLLNGAHTIGQQVIGQIPSNWQVAGTADFNGDHDADILLHSAAGGLIVLEMNGTQIIANQFIGQIPSNWHVGGTGDFNADGKSDIVLLSDAGGIIILEMNGTQIIANQFIGQIPGNWHVAGTGDFNADGKSDILLHSDAGGLIILEMNGTQIIANQFIGQIPPNWHVAGTAEVNGDGKSDIILTSDAGASLLLEMNGTQIVLNQLISPNATPALPSHAQAAPPLDASTDAGTVDHLAQAGEPALTLGGGLAISPADAGGPAPGTGAAAGLGGASAALNAPGGQMPGEIGTLGGLGPHLLGQSSLFAHDPHLMV